MNTRQLLVLLVGMAYSVIVTGQKAIYGLATPLAIQHGQTVLYKTDYFPFNTPIMKVDWPQGLTMVKETPDAFYLSGKLLRPYDNIHFKLLGGEYDIPCRNTRNLNKVLQIELAEPAYLVSIKGSFNAWVSDSTMLKPAGKLPTRKWIAENLSATEGYHQYKLIVANKEINPVNSILVSNGMGGTNSQMVVGNPDAEPPHASTVSHTSNQTIKLRISNAFFYMAYWNNRLIIKGAVPLSQTITITIPKKALEEKRSHIRVYTSNQHKAGNDILIPLEYGKVVQDAATQLTREDLHRQMMYFMMVDRFANGDQSNDPKPLDSVLPKAQYFGGDLAGIQQKIQSGFFKDLGMNTLWLSPISQNAEGAWGYWNKAVTTKFSAYHGYWPTSYSQVDFRFGSSKTFTDVIQDAHQNQMNVVLDFVAHHVHVNHPLYQKNPSWATSLYLPDGSMNTERWDDHRLTTWFDSFLPTLDLRRQEVREVVADSIMFWVNNYDLDGFRHDASKHVPEEFWRLLTAKIKRRVVLKPTSTAFYQIGETYGSPELISSYVNSGQMNGQFDFNLYDASVGAFGFSMVNDTAHWIVLKRTLSQSFDFYGWHHLMGNISGNQDRPRFTSIADGSVKPDEDAKLAGWTRTIENANDLGYARMAQLQAFNFTIPGVPVIYYGDEYAMPGANDPDNRRMMQFEGYNGNQSQIIAKVKKLTHLRSQSLPLLYGEFTMIETDKSFFAYERNFFGKKVLVVFSKKAGAVYLPLTYNLQQATTMFDHAANKTAQGYEVKMNDNDVAIFEIK